MDKDLFEVYKSDTSGKKISKPIISHSVRLPINDETAKEPIEANIKKPMNWKTFKKLHGSTKKLYISYLRQTYKATDVQIAKMLGCDNSTLSKYCRNLKIPKVTSKATNEDRVAWNAFVGMQEITPVLACEEESPVIKPVIKPCGMTCNRTQIELQGNFNAEYIMQKLTALYEEGTPCKVTICVEDIKQEPEQKL